MERLKKNFSPRFPPAPLCKWNRNICPKYEDFQLHIQPPKPGLTAEKEAITAPNFKAPELQESECPFPIRIVLQKGTAALATASVAATQAGQQLRCSRHFSQLTTYNACSSQKAKTT